MKRLFSFALAAAFAFGLASCSKDVDNGSGTGNDGDAVLTFTLKNPKGSYTTRAIAEGAEWDMDNIDVYAFFEGQMINGKKLTEDTDFEATEDNGITTIKMNSYWVSEYANKTVTFYFVANNDGHIAAAPAAKAEADFKNLLSKELAVDAQGKAALIETPLLFSATEEIEIVGRIQANVTMKRREARFDIVNKANDVVEIDAIRIMNANRSGYIFSDGTGATIKQASLQDITCPVTADYDEDGLATSVFYLYPTKLGVDAGETNIIIEAYVDSQLDSYILSEESYIDILPNTRYKLLLDPFELIFTIQPEDYDEGEEIETEPGADSDIDLDAFTASTPANWDEGTLTYDFTDNAAGQTLTFTATTKYGTDYKVKYVAGEQDGLDSDIEVDVKSVSTYSEHKVVDTYTISVPTYDKSMFYEIHLEVFSEGGDATQTIIFKKDMQVRDVVKDPALLEYVKNIISKNYEEKVTQEDLESVVEIKVGNNTEIKSLEGIENFPKLAKLEAQLNENITEVDVTKNLELVTLNLTETSISEIDISNNPLLEYLSVHTTSITKLDISNNPLLNNIHAHTTGITELDVSHLTNLIYLRVHNTGISTIDVTNSPKLITLRVDKTNITEVDVTNNPKLKQLEVYETGITEIDVTNNPELDTFIIFNTAIKTLDISNNNLIKRLLIQDCEELEVVYVWDGFDVEDPASNFPTPPEQEWEMFENDNCPAVFIVKQ